MPNRLLIFLTIVLFNSCQFFKSSLYEEMNQIAGFDEFENLILIKKGKEDGFPDSLMAYEIYKVESKDFEYLFNSVLKKEEFKKGNYYLNIELDDYLIDNKLEVINMNNSLVFENEYDCNYYLYLLSDRQRFVVCKVNY